MNADFHHYDMEILAHTPNGIINEVWGINRVANEITSKPP